MQKKKDVMSMKLPICGEKQAPPETWVGRSLWLYPEQ